MKKHLYVLALLAGMLAVQPAPATGADRTDQLHALHDRILPILDNPTPENPFYLNAENRDDRESGEAALFVPQSVEALSATLSEVKNWCNILPLHINVKACTYDENSSTMTLYMGRKHYQSPGDAFELVYQLKTERQDGYFRATATADEGPLKSSNYRIELEFITIGDKTFGRIYVSNHISWLSGKAMDVYLSTLGKDKQGIKVVDHDAQGRPIYSSGAVAVAERNLVRYYFAFMAYFRAADEKNTELRYEQQLQDWFAHTERFPQLFEMGEQEYLEAKRRERQNQLALQRQHMSDKQE